MIPPRIRSVSALENFCLELIYETDEKKIYDAKKLLNHPGYKNLNNEIYFKKVKSVQTTVEWPNGEDIDPNDLYENSTNAI